MTTLRSRFAAGCAALALAFQAPAVLASAPAAAPGPAAPAAAKPALWKVADADTTIYLFGTVHALPKTIEWFGGPVAEALAKSGTLVTEIAPGTLEKPETGAAFMAKATLPEGQTLRGLLNAEQRAAYEGAMKKLGMPAEAFDRFEPWFASLMLVTIPMMKAGYTREAGVEHAVEAKAAKGVTRAALETVDQQLKLFDELPMPVQIAYLNELATRMDTVMPSLDAMVAAWAKGDAEGLAKLMNDELTDPALADRLLYARNRNWAQWLETRLEQPGTVFVAVGAGHLAGANSVQDYLGKEGIAVTRVQ